MYMLTTFSASIRDVDGVPLISASQGLLNPWNRMLKGVMDYVGALLALIVFSPVFLYAAWKTKRDDGGKVFFQHERVGRNLISFKMYKFSEDNPRITKADKSSRKMNLDEIPRIFNVLRGEMSLIGPCPTIKREVELYYGEETARQIFRVKPGVTGFWQVSGRNDVPDYQSRIDLDLYYIHNWSLWLDIIILFRTARMLIDAHRAY
jgi:undecaprenyl-phosphate galactose phosphotransferase